MLNFKLIEKNDINYFKQFYDYSEAFGCDVNLLNAYLWRNEYNIKFTVFEDTLIKAYFNDDGTVWGYCMPTGKNVKQALVQILTDAQQRGQKAHIVMLTNAQRAMLESTFPSAFEYVRSPENQDYIYLTKDLVMLAGKKFHAKRNHISKFYRTYTDTRFETIDDSNEQDALQVVRDWCEENGYNPKGYEELAVIEEALEMRRDYGLSGAVLYVDNKPVAMTLGSQISEKVYDVNFEKALREYDGVYAVINNEFAKTLTKYEYINREEDMGIEGLRKSKLSYNPIMILDRFNAIPR
ncbi:MAG TPA: hypothetical protein DD413_06540 [Ruminococcus sp.]|nr:hypothetical protein [Ruminococcus sp.]